MAECLYVHVFLFLSVPISLCYISTGTDIGDPDLVSSHFPSLSTNSSQSLGFTQWYGEFIWINQFGRWSPDAWVFGGKQSGPIAIFDETAARTVVVSPYSNFMAASHLYSDATEGGVAWGILGSIQHYPPNYSLQVVLHAHAGGINSAMEEWGSLLLTTYNKPSDGPAFDYTVQYLGYNTDHVGYCCCCCTALSLLDLKKPFQHPREHTTITTQRKEKITKKRYLTYTIIPNPSMSPTGSYSLILGGKWF